jgi:hypothetical protein
MRGPAKVADAISPMPRSPRLCQPYPYPCPYPCPYPYPYPYP